VEGPKLLRPLPHPQSFGDEKKGLVNHAQPSNGRVAQCFPVIRPQRPSNWHGRFAILAEMPAVRAGRTRQGVMQAGVRREIGRILGRSVRRKITRRGAHLRASAFHGTDRHRWPCLQ
jgi:hypothetical protein